MDLYQPIQSDLALNSKIWMLVLSMSLLVLSVTFAGFWIVREKLVSLFLVFMLLVNLGMLILFYYLI
jgi:hypothetical protein